MPLYGGTESRLTMRRLVAHFDLFKLYKFRLFKTSCALNALLMIAVLTLTDFAAAQTKPAVPDNDLIEAARKGDVYGILKALDGGIHVNDRGRDRRPAIIVAAEWGHLEAVQYLIQRGASVDLRDQEDQTALGAAVLWGRRDVAELLLSSGADPNRSALDNEVPLITAARLGDFAMTELLISQGADRDETDRTGRTALDWARQSRHRKIVNVLSAAR